MERKVVKKKKRIFALRERIRILQIEKNDMNEWFRITNKVLAELRIENRDLKDKIQESQSSK
jgi:hypothetical protein